MPVLGANEAHVKFTQALSDGTTVTTDGGPEELCDVTEIPIGHNVIVAQYLRNATTTSVDISSLDILSLSVQNVVLVFGATDDQYQIDILTTDTHLQSLTTSMLIDRLSLQDVKPA